jgi:hypothetical protein
MVVVDLVSCHCKHGSRMEFVHTHTDTHTHTKFVAIVREIIILSNSFCSCRVAVEF